MPTAPPSRCIICTCPHWATRRGRCEDHQPQPWTTPSANTRALTGSERTKINREQLAREPNCRHCGAPATQADHIIPIGDGGAITSPQNLQSLCDPCHEKKTKAENRARRNRTAPGTPNRA